MENTKTEGTSKPSCMKVLHIISNVYSSKVYDKIIFTLDRKGVIQYVYCTLYKNQLEKNFNFDEAQSRVISSHILNFLNKIILPYKIYKIYYDIVRKNIIEKIDIIHCHSFFTSSTVGTLLAYKYNKKIIVTFRSTDIDIYIKYIKIYNFFIYKVLKVADAIIFISHSNKQKLLDKSILDGHESFVIPNGIDKFWLNNINTLNKSKLSEISVLYVGKKNKNKNIERLIKAVELLRAQEYEIKLILVGDNNESYSLPYIISKGYINNKNMLLKIYRNADIFAMVSLRETFGLVYIEALSQGLPIIYSKGQGIDGYFKEKKIGEAVNPKSIKSIAKGIENIINKYNKYDEITAKDLSIFEWKNIGKTYKKIYEKLYKK